ncbi:MAG: Fe-S protein assembly chaperone HscA [Bacteroidetes bacterium]|nr:Fe-S protein assembly chaperone HscA [Bacteroidota bacterium]
MAKIKIDIASGKVAKAAVVVGIDLGTTNSLVAYVNPQTHQPEIIVDEMGSLVPSVIGFQPGQLPQVGYIAKEGLIASPDRTIYSVKRLLGRSYKDVSDVQSFLSYRIIDDETDALVKVMIDDAFYNPIELSAIILKSLKQKAEKALGADVNQAVITVPAYFNDAQRQATRDAGKLAGLDVLRILNEPTAASLSYGLNATEAERVLVYDLGGGTFDVSILAIEDGVFEVLSTKGDTVLGGDDIDGAVMQFWMSEQPVLQRLDAGERQKLRLMAEEAKIGLSGNSSLEYRDHIEVGGVKLDLTLNYGQLQAAANPILQKTQQCIAAALKDAQLKESQIQAVVMVGGSTRYPEIYHLLTSLFPHVQVNNQINPDEVVALGAAIEADVLAGNRSDVLLLDVTPLSLGIETAGGLMDVLIPRNSKIPARVGREYTTSIDGQVNMKIAVFQGEREMVAENRKLGEFILKGIPAMPAGFPKIEVSFAIDANGMLQVRAKELRSNVSQEIEITPQYGLTDAQVEKMLLDGFQFAQSDVQLRLQQEAVNEAQQLIYLAKRFLDKNGEMMSEEEIEGTKQRIQELERLLQSQASKDEILAAVTGLNDYTRPFAERLMDVAVASALKGKGI